MLHQLGGMEDDIFIVKTDIDIARAAEIKAIEIIAAKVGIGDEYLEQYGKYKAKVNLSIIPEKLKDHKDGKLILVTAISPTPAGEGKTTTSVGLVLQMTNDIDSKNLIGPRAV